MAPLGFVSLPRFLPQAGGEEGARLLRPAGPTLPRPVSPQVEFTEEQGKLFFFKYPVAGSDEFLPVATTRPETILGDTAVAVNPNDPRYQHLVGKMCRVPMSDREIPIIGKDKPNLDRPKAGRTGLDSMEPGRLEICLHLHPYRSAADDYVDMEFGTGALKITPGHDPNDYEIGKRFNLPIINIMNKDASLNEKAGAYSGLDRFEARKKLWADMEAQGLTIKVDPYNTRVPR